MQQRRLTPAGSLEDKSMVDIYIEASAGIVSTYVAHNTVSCADLPDLLAQVHTALRNLETGGMAEYGEETKLVPAVPIRKSVTPDYIISLEDGKKYKSLKRHLRARYGLSPEEYRAKWGLPADYPMVASNYAKERSYLAKRMNLGQIRKNGSGRMTGAPKPRGG